MPASGTTSTKLAWARLLRIALAPTALADVAAGIVLGAGTWPSGLHFALLMLAALCVYHGAMALNDWADRAWDQKTRSDRPLPAKLITPRSALTVALILLASGPLFALLAVSSNWTHPASVACVTATSLSAVFAIAYDLGPRGPLLGPLLLAACRALNLASGVFFGLSAVAAESASPSVLGLLVIPAYGAYVFIVSRLGRLEDGEAGHPLERLPSRYCRRLAVLLAGVGALACLRSVLFEGSLPSWPALLPLAVGLAGAAQLWKLSRRSEWSHADVIEAMGCALRRFLIFAACCTLLVPGLASAVVALLILCGFPLSFWLRKVAPPS